MNEKCKNKRILTMLFYLYKDCTTIVKLPCDATYVIIFYLNNNQCKTVLKNA